MRRRFAQIVIFTAVWLLADKPHVRAQSAACPPRSESASDDKEPSDPEILIAQVTFSGFLQMPISDQDHIAASIKDGTYGRSLDGVKDEAVERVKAGWQDRGYFKVQVSGKERGLTSSIASRRIALSFHVQEGPQYLLSEITFKHNDAMSDVTLLRGVFPINDGDIFSREKVAMGLENLRKAYGALGYINFTSVPETIFDDDRKLISLDIDIDEGKQFYLTRIDVLGLDEPSQQELLKDAPIGQVYNQRLFQQFVERHAAILPPYDDPSHVTRRLDERAGTVAITLDARPCTVD